MQESDKEKLEVLAAEALETQQQLKQETQACRAPENAAQAEEELRRQTDILRMVMDGMADGVTVCDTAGMVFIANRPARRMLSLHTLPVSIEEMSNHFHWLRPNSKVPYRFEERPLVRALHGHPALNCEGTITYPDSDDCRYISASAKPLHDAQGILIGAVNVFRDITEAKRIQRALLQAEEQFRLLVEGTIDYAIFGLDSSGRIATWNVGAKRLFGYKTNEVMGQSVAMFFTEEAILRGVPEQELADARALGRSEESGIRVRKDSSRFYVTGVVNTLFAEDGELRGYVKVLKDHTEQHLAEEKMAFLANHDALTGLANRKYFNEQLAHAIEQGKAEQTSVAVLLLDMDRFKNVNDTLGHHVGDLLLQEIATRLEENVRRSDIVARLGGDEFAIIQPHVTSREEVKVLAKKLVDALSQPYQLDGNEVHSGTSIGITLFPPDGADSTSLMKNADMAMYRAKSRGRGNYQFFEETLRQEAQARQSLEDELRRALDKGEFELFYQPQIDLNNLAIIGAEALLRWRNPSLNDLPTARVIAIAEETGLILPIGEWALKEACRQNRAWQTAGLQPIRVGVNLSPRQLTGMGFIRKLDRILDQTGLSPDWLALEITEGLLMHHTDSVHILLAEIKNRSIQISVDDFGTGFAALSHLRDFPVDVIKLDHSLIHLLPDSRNDAAIAEAAIGLANRLGIKIIAEGVETEMQRGFLKEVGCTAAQGYLFAPPLSVIEMEDLLLTNERTLTP